jgi:hypothetical protein
MLNRLVMSPRLAGISVYLVILFIAGKRITKSVGREAW